MPTLNFKNCPLCGGEIKAKISEVEQGIHVCTASCTRCERVKLEVKNNPEVFNEYMLRLEACAVWNKKVDDAKFNHVQWIPFRAYIRELEGKVMELLKEGMNEESIAQQMGVPTKYIFEFLYQKGKIR